MNSAEPMRALFQPFEISSSTSISRDVRRSCTFRRRRAVAPSPAVPSGNVRSSSWAVALAITVSPCAATLISASRTSAGLERGTHPRAPARSAVSAARTSPSGASTSNGHTDASAATCGDEASPASASITATLTRVRATASIPASGVRHSATTRSPPRSAMLDSPRRTRSLRPTTSTIGLPEVVNGALSPVIPTNPSSRFARANWSEARVDGRNYRRPSEIVTSERSPAHRHVITCQFSAEM